MINIIGAGPIGLMTGSHLAKNNNCSSKVKIYEEHNKIGEPVQCTGIVTNEILKIIQIKKSIIVNKIKKAQIISKNNKIELPVNDLIIDRIQFDNHIKDMTIDNGAQIITNKKITISKIKNLKGKIIGADGPNSIIRKQINPKLKINYYVGKQAVVKGDFQKDVFKVYVGSIAPNFFSWIVPINETTARIGLAVKNNPSLHFKKFIKSIKIKKVINYQAGLIPIYNPKIKTQLNNKYIVGDAATQIKASTGGGLIPGLKCAKILANSIINKTNYDKDWRKKLAKELFTHNLIRKTLNNFSDKNYNELIAILNNEKSLFKKYGRDSGFKLLSNLILKQPKLIKYGFKIF
jgi:digeranylgeranylglycerophospholipid reductase